MGVYLSMFMCNVYPRKTFYPILVGTIIEGVGVGVLAFALWQEHKATIFGMMALTGAGTGMRFMPTSLHVKGFFPRHIATVLSLMAVALPFGGTFILTVMATVFNNVTGFGSDRDSISLDDVPQSLRLDVIHRAKVCLIHLLCLPETDTGA